MFLLASKERFVNGNEKKIRMRKRTPYMEDIVVL